MFLLEMKICEDYIFLQSLAKNSILDRWQKSKEIILQALETKHPEFTPHLSTYCVT
jgi:hypothetical protein